MDAIAEMLQSSSTEIFEAVARGPLISTSGCALEEVLKLISDLNLLQVHPVYSMWLFPQT